MTPFTGGTRFRAALQHDGGATAGFVVPPGVALDPDGGIQVITVNGLRLPAAVGRRNGRPWLTVDAGDCAAAELSRGQVTEVELDPPVRSTRA
jgi:hypothetical protein